MLGLKILQRNNVLYYEFKVLSVILCGRKYKKFSYAAMATINEGSIIGDERYASGIDYEKLTTLKGEIYR